MGRRGVRELGVLRLPPPDPQEVPLTLGFNLTFQTLTMGEAAMRLLLYKTKKGFGFLFFFFSIFIGCK